MLKIKKIAIKNFRSIESMSIDCSNITTFVGANDAGKSNVLRALSLFFNGRTDHDLLFNFKMDYNNFAVKKINKAQEVIVELNIELPETYQREGYPSDIVWRKVWRTNGLHQDGCYYRYADKQEFPPRSRIPNMLEKIVYNYVPAIKDKNFFTDLQGQVYDVLQTVAEVNLRKSAAAFESEIQEHLKDLLFSVSEVFNVVSDMRMPANLRQVFENLEFNSEGIPLSRRGDGIKVRHIPMILRFIAEKRNSIHKQGISHHIWGFEEPENNVEMTSCFEMANQFIEASKDEYQIFITTHSPVFYGISVTNADLVRAHGINKVGSFSKIEPLSKEAADQEMGLMRLVTPYVNKEREEWVARNQVIQIELDKLNAEKGVDKNLPRIFAEGKTDKLVLEKAISVFYPQYLSKVKIDCDGNDGYGGAEAASNRAKAWFLHEQHESQPIKGALLLDMDSAGAEAKQKFDENINNKNRPIVKSFYWVISAKPIGLDAGFELPIDLEYLYSEDVWDMAQQEGWLEDIKNAGERLSKNKRENILADAIAGKQYGLFDGVDTATDRRIKKQFKDIGKVKAAKWIEKTDIELAKKHLSQLEPTIKDILHYLFGDLNAH